MGAAAELEDWVRDEAATALGAPARAVRLLHRREGALVLRVEVGDGAVVLRLTSPEAARGDDQRTAAVVSRVRAAGVPAPEVLSTGPALRTPWRRSVEEHVDGSPWRDVVGGCPPRDVQAVHADLAAAVVALQTVRPGGFGELGSSARDPVLAALHARADLRVPPGPRQEVAHDVLVREAALFTDERQAAVVTHDDLHAANVLVRQTRTGWRLAALLDWEKAWAGPVDADVARLALWEGMTGPAFWATYRAAVPERDGDARRALVLQLLWCLEHDWPTARHRADTARLQAALGV